MVRSRRNPPHRAPQHARRAKRNDEQLCGRGAQHRRRFCPGVGRVVMMGQGHLHGTGVPRGRLRTQQQWEVRDRISEVRQGWSLTSVIRHLFVTRLDHLPIRNPACSRPGCDSRSRRGGFDHFPSNRHFRGVRIGKSFENGNFFTLNLDYPPLRVISASYRYCGHSADTGGITWPD